MAPGYIRRAEWVRLNVWLIIEVKCVLWSFHCYGTAGSKGKPRLEMPSPVQLINNRSDCFLLDHTLSGSFPAPSIVYLKLPLGRTRQEQCFLGSIQMPEQLNQTWERRRRQPWSREEHSKAFSQVLFLRPYLWKHRTPSSREVRTNAAQKILHHTCSEARCHSPSGLYTGKTQSD